VIVSHAALCHARSATANMRGYSMNSALSGDRIISPQRQVSMPYHTPTPPTLIGLSPINIDNISNFQYKELVPVINAFSLATMRQK